MLNGADTWLRTRTGWHNPVYGTGMYSSTAGVMRGYITSKLHMFNTGADSIKTEGGIRVGGTSNYGRGVTGLYSATRFQNVFSMGEAYQLGADGVSPGNMYGVAWTHSNNNNANAKKISGHHACFMTNGVTKTAVGDHIWTSGNVTALGVVKGADAIATSDMRVKTNIVKISYASEILGELDGCYFNRLDMDGKSHAGLLAQQLLRVFPAAVVKTPDESMDDGIKLSVSLPAVVGLLAQGHNEHTNEIGLLKRENEALKTRLANLEMMMEKLING